MLALALALVVQAAAAAAPAAPSRPPRAGAPTAKPPAAPAARPAAAPAGDEALEADVAAFISTRRDTAARDGGVKLPWDGPGGAQLRLSWSALDRRNEQIWTGDTSTRALLDVVQAFYDTEGGGDAGAIRAKLKELAGPYLEEARAAYLDAISCEERRLFFVEKAVAEAKTAGEELPGVDADLVRRRLAAIREGRVKRALTVQLDGYRDLALGIVAYLDGDSFGALERVRSAAQALPDLAVAHAFAGSMYFLFGQRDAAVRAWRRASELDPSNKAVAEALSEHGSTKRQRTSSN